MLFFVLDHDKKIGRHHFAPEHCLQQNTERRAALCAVPLRKRAIFNHGLNMLVSDAPALVHQLCSLCLSLGSDVTKLLVVIINRREFGTAAASYC